MISVIQSTNILSTFRPIKERNTLFCISSFIALNIKLGNISTKNKTIKRSWTINYKLIRNYVDLLFYFDTHIYLTSVT